MAEIRAYTMGDFAKLKLPHTPWLVPGLLPGTGWTLLMAPSKVGKSILALQLAEGLARGTGFLGVQVPHPRRVLYIQGDAPAGDWQEQIRALAPDGTSMTVAGLPGYFLADAGIRTRLREIAGTIHAEFIVWDALYKLGPWDTNTISGIAEVSRHIRLVSGVPYLLIHHPAKWTVQPGGSGAGTYAAAGSFALASDASAVWTLSATGLTVTGRNVATRTIPLVRESGGRWKVGREDGGGGGRSKSGRGSLRDLLEIPA